jgi:transcriptional regulator with XRE-family HTH domain
MRHAGLSQSALAAKARISRSTVGRILRRAVDADDDTLERLARALQQPQPDVRDPRWTTGDDEGTRWDLAAARGEGDTRAGRGRRVGDAVARFVLRNDLTGARREKLVEYLKVQISWATEHDLDPGDLWDVMRALREAKSK